MVERPSHQTGVGTLAEATVTQGGLLLTIPSDADMGSLRVEAIDSSGGIIAATQWVERGVRTAGQADWD